MTYNWAENDVEGWWDVGGNAEVGAVTVDVNKMLVVG